jgi:hypothetical protein
MRSDRLREPSSPGFRQGTGTSVRATGGMTSFTAHISSRASLLTSSIRFVVSIPQVLRHHTCPAIEDVFGDAQYLCELFSQTVRSGGAPVALEIVQVLRRDRPSTSRRSCTSHFLYL